MIIVFEHVNRKKTTKTEGNIIIICISLLDCLQKCIQRLPPLPNDFLCILISFYSAFQPIFNIKITRGNRCSIVTTLCVIYDTVCFSFFFLGGDATAENKGVEGVITSYSCVINTTQRQRKKK